MSTLVALPLISDEGGLVNLPFVQLIILYFLESYSHDDWVCLSIVNSHCLATPGQSLVCDHTTLLWNKYCTGGGVGG